MTAPIFVPGATVTHPGVVPYISIAEYQSAPTAVDASQLVQGGTLAENLVELSNVIRRASSWADGLCFQILASTLDTQTDSGIYVGRDGCVRVCNRFWPLIELDSFSVGPRPSLMAPVVNTADIWLDGRSVLVVPVTGVSAPGLSPYQASVSGGVRPGDEVYCSWTYWNGWLHSSLAAPAVLGATSLTLATPLPAASAGKTLVVRDGSSTEVVQVAAAFTGGTDLLLANSTLNAHTPGAFPNAIMVTALEDRQLQAIISLTSALIKLQGASADVMDTIGDAPSKESLIQGGGLDDYQVAVDLLERYRADY